MMKSPLFAVLALLVAVCPAALASQPDHTPETRLQHQIEAVIDDFIAEKGYSGAVLVADRRGKILFEGAYGFADDGEEAPFTLDTAVDIGSNAKAYAAAAILTLARDGKLVLQDPISTYMPNVPADKSLITFHQLLSHSSGLPDEYQRSYTEVSREEMEQTILAQPLLFRPGTDYSYSDMGYALIDALVERISGQPFQSYLRSKVLSPFGLAHTGFLADPRWKFTGGTVAVARGYNNGREVDSPIDLPRDTWTPIGGGTVLSTVRDGLIWQSGLLEGKILGEEWSALLFRPHTKIKENLWYGYGWQVVQSPSRGLIYRHSGATSSHNYYSQYLVDHGVYIITASNRIDGRYNDKDHSGTIEDDEIIEETIYATKLGGALSKLIATVGFVAAP
jgi:CubicO group peptidase (beta-lactamase class C family)